ncbi:MAG: hypothetical protein ACREUT_21790 [Steroidobacteraceae bacterium]
MSKIEYRGDLKDVVRAVLQVVTNRVKAGRPPEPERAAELVPSVLSLLRVNVSTMTKDRADSLVEEVRDQIREGVLHRAYLNGEFTDEQLEALAFLMRNGPARGA